VKGNACPESDKTTVITALSNVPQIVLRRRRNTMLKTCRNCLSLGATTAQRHDFSAANEEFSVHGCAQNISPKTRDSEECLRSECGAINGNEDSVRGTRFRRVKKVHTFPQAPRVESKAGKS
jgi:hypothetical protein